MIENGLFGLFFEGFLGCFSVFGEGFGGFLGFTGGF